MYFSMSMINFTIFCENKINCSYTYMGRVKSRGIDAKDFPSLFSSSLKKNEIEICGLACSIFVKTDVCLISYMQYKLFIGN